jgi:RNA polymerase-binding transcription factor DksA
MTGTSTPIPPGRPDDLTALDWLRREEQRTQRTLARLRASGLDAQTEEEDLGELASASQHPADVASETMEREVDLGLIEDFERAIDEIAAARQRVVAGRYGICERCHAYVDPSRLEAVPATRYCWPCAHHEHLAGLWIGVGRRPAVLVCDEFLADDDRLADEHDDRCAEERAVNVALVTA